MDLFVKKFKTEIPFTYPWQQEYFLPKLGLCGTLSDGIFNSEDTLITDKIEVEFTSEAERWNPIIKEFYNIKDTQWVSNLEAEKKFMVESTKIKGKVRFKPLNFESEGDFYYRAIHLGRDYIPNPKNQLENSIKTALKNGIWKRNDVVITSILYGKNPLILKATKKGCSIIGGEISVDLPFSDINFKAGLIRNDESISARFVLNPDEEVIVGFQTMGLKGFLRKRLEKYKGEDTNNSHDIFEDIYNDFSENESDIEYILEYV
jgi:hypothetical protein